MSRNISPKFFSSSSNFLSPNNNMNLQFERTFIGESAPNSSMREVLLMKCKSAIEELHQEIEDLQRTKASIEERSSRLDRELIEKDNQIKQERYFKEKLEDEMNDIKANFLSISEKSSYLEDKLRYFQENESKYEDLKRNFQMLCETNEDLKERYEEQVKETSRREGLSKEWEDTLSNVNQNLRDLTIENDALKEEREEFIKKIESLQKELEQDENIKASFEKQLELIEKLRVEFQEVQNALLDKSEEVNSERKENEKLRKLLDLAETNLKDQFKEHDRNMKLKINEIENLLTDKHKVEMDQFKQEMFKSLDKMDNIKAKTDEEFLKLKEEKEALKQDCRLLSEKIIQKDVELKESTEKSRKRGEELSKETGKMQKIIEDQNEIITKLEKIIDKERNEKAQIQKDNEEGKENVRQYIEKNAFLTEKLKASHQEIEDISKDVRRTFENEDEKNQVFLKRIKELEGLVIEKEKTFDGLNKEYIKMKAGMKKQKTDISNLSMENKDLREESNKHEMRLLEIVKENDSLKAKHNDFQEALKERMEEFSGDLKLERENRMQEQKYARELEDKIMTIENQYKNEIGFLKTELLRKERECEKLKIKHDDLNFNLMNAQNSYNNNLQSNRDEKKIGNESKPFIEFEKPEKELNELKNQIDRFENQTLKEKLRRKMEEDKKNFSLNERAVPAETAEFMTARTNPQSREFIDRFKGIINKLEDKLSKMSYELKMSDSFGPN